MTQPMVIITCTCKWPASLTASETMVHEGQAIFKGNRHGEEKPLSNTLSTQARRTLFCAQRYHRLLLLR